MYVIHTVVDGQGATLPQGEGAANQWWHAIRVLPATVAIFNYYSTQVAHDFFLLLY